MPSGETGGLGRRDGDVTNTSRWDHIRHGKRTITLLLSLRQMRVDGRLFSTHIYTAIDCPNQPRANQPRAEQSRPDPLTPNHPPRPPTPRPHRSTAPPPAPRPSRPPLHLLPGPHSHTRRVYPGPHYPLRTACPSGSPPRCLWRSGATARVVLAPCLALCGRAVCATGSR